MVEFTRYHNNQGGRRVAATYFRKKSAEAIRAAHDAHVRGEHQHGPAMKRALGFWSLTALGIGCTIGTGIFVMSGHYAAQTGPAMVLSFLFAALACGLAALSYCELACLIPASGSAYSYAYVALGEVVAWMIGWALLLEYGLANSAVAAGWGGYLDQVLGSIGIHIPATLLYPPGAPIPDSHLVGVLNLPAVISITIVTVLMLLGIRESARANNTLVALKCGALLMFVAFCASKFDPARMHPFMPTGWEGMKAGAADIFFLFVGFDAVSTVAEEALDAQRDMPRGIVAALAIVTVLYVSVGLVLTGMFPLDKLKDMTEPLAQGLQVANHPMAATLLSLVAVSGILSVLLVGAIGQTRILYIMSRDGLMPGFMADLSPRTGTPVACTILLGVVTAVLAAVVPIGDLADLVSIGTLAAFCVVSVAVVIMRKKAPDLPRKFRCPWVPALPIAGVLINLYLMTYLSQKIWVAFGIWMTIGLVVYFAWSHRSASRVYVPYEPEPGPILAEG